MMFGLFLNANLASARLITSQPTAQVPFFKSPESQFPSGFTTAEFLNRQKISQNRTPQKMIKWNNHLFSMAEVKPVLSAHLSEFVIEQKTKQRWPVIATLPDQIQVSSIKKLPLDEVSSDPTDLGYALTLKDVYLRKQADTDAAILTTIPQGFKIKAFNYKKNFAEVRYKDYTGFVSLSEVVTKFDLATMVLFKQRWHFVSKREFAFMMTSENLKIPLSEITGVLTPDTKGVIATSQQKIPLWSQVEIINHAQAHWIQSQLKGHGMVWWKPETSDLNSTVSIDELLKQKISSVSFHPKNPSKAVLSANGVYLTEDGLNWKRLNQFEDFNGPVHYFNDLLLFVGNYRSTDGGKTFENYIQIDKLASAIEDQYGFLPRQMQVQKIETYAPFKIQIEIETGFRKIKMESPLFAQDWKAVKI